ncbi:MAG: acyl-CoA dehydrogenase family protein [Dehalococcoidia bacterium]|nr:acyl-CoA dehydrogenase family protein [Dehalococcoidia bacterium]
MDFGFTEEEQAFRQEVRTVLTSILPPDWAAKSLRWPGGSSTIHIDRDDEERRATYERALKCLVDKGWWSMVWPDTERGGRSNIEKAIFAEELSYQQGPALSAETMIVAPVIMVHGTEENKREWLPRIASKEVEFYVGYSEPNHGSDLASIETTAVEDEESFVLNGQKIWTSLAHEATHGWVIARTDPDRSKKQRGISLFVVDSKLPGVTVRPLLNMLDLHHFNEVFFDNVRVPKRCLIGEKNKGFQYLITALDFERLMLVPIGGLRRVFEEIVQYARETVREGKTLSTDPIVRQKLAQLAIDIEIASLFQYRTACMLDKGQVPASEGSMLHLFGNELSMRLAEVAAQIMGPYGALRPGSKWAPMHGKVAYGLMDAVSGKIGGGTPEIQRNVIATKGLGLPRR